MRGMSSAVAKAGKVINKAFAFFTYASIALLAFEDKNRARKIWVTIGFC